MLGTIIEQNGDGLLEDFYMPVGWPLHIDGAVRQCCIHRACKNYFRSHWLKPLAQGRIGSNPVGLGNSILTQGANIHLG